LVIVVHKAEKEWEERSKQHSARNLLDRQTKYRNVVLHLATDFAFPSTPE
jgi:hypothetical protein